MNKNENRSNRQWAFFIFAAGGALLGTTAVALGIWASWRSSNRSFHKNETTSTLTRPQPPPNDFVGSQQCAQCHPKIAAIYRSHPKAHSLVPISKELAAAGQYPPPNGAKANAKASPENPYEFSPIPKKRYSVERKPEGTFHQETGFDEQDEILYTRTAEIHFAVGAGTPTRAYLTNRDGWIFVSPIAWSASEEKWRLFSGYSPERHPGFEREATDRCLQCHAGRLDRRERSTAHVQNYGQKLFLEHGIGCERCHGPGKRHIEFHQTTDKPSADQDPIINPAHLDPAQRDDVCNQCHLYGRHQILRYGRTNSDFRPGNHLGEIWTTFIQSDAWKDVKQTPASQIEQIRDSRCYIASQGRLGCTSCHDPHQAAPSKAPAYYRSRCLNCHGEQDCKSSPADRRRTVPSDSCIDCHMPQIANRGEIHRAHTDHRIRAKPQWSNPLPESQMSNPLNNLRVYGADVYLPSALARDRVSGLLLARSAEEFKNRAFAVQAEEMLLPSLQAAPDDVDVLDALALTATLQGKADSATLYWEKAVKVDPHYLNALYSLAVHYQNRGDIPNAIESLNRFLKLNPWAAPAHGRLSYLQFQAGDSSGALKSGKFALSLNPSLPTAYAWLAELYQRQRDPQQSQKYREIYLRFPKRKERKAERR